MSKILLCQTAETQLPGLHAALTRKGYDIETVPDIEALENLEDGPALEDINLDAIDVAVIDVSCGRDATPSCQALNRYHPSISLVLLVSEDIPIEAEHKQLTCGNVLQLPFTPRKVINRVQKLLDSQSERALEVGELTLNLATRCVHRGDITHRLTPKQASLLEVFMRHAGQTLTRKFLMAEVWNTDYMGDTRTLDVHVRWIRERIEEEPSSPKYLRTVRGIGYRFGDPSEE